MGRDMSITLHQLRPFGAQSPRMALHRAVWSRVLSPCFQPTYALGERPLPRGMIRVPHPLVHRLADSTQGLRGSLPDCETCREKTPDARHVFHQGFPGPLRGLPPVGMHGFRGLIRGDRLGFLGTDP